MSVPEFLSWSLAIGFIAMLAMILVAIGVFLYILFYDWE